MADSRPAGSQRPAVSSSFSAPADAPQPTPASPAGNKSKKKKRTGKKRKHRPHSFIAPEDNSSAVDSDRPITLERAASSNPRTSFYRLGRGNKSSESLESEALLDHRESGPLQARRQSIQQGVWGNNAQSRFGLSRLGRNGSASRLSRSGTAPTGTPQDAEQGDDSTPLLSSSYWREGLSRANGYGSGSSPSIAARLAGVLRRPSRGSSMSSPRPSGEFERNLSKSQLDDYDVNNPPSVPGSPVLEAARDYADTVFMDQVSGDAIVDVDRMQEDDNEIPPTPLGPGHLKRRMTMAAEEDVCFPQDILSEIAEEEEEKRAMGQESTRTHRRRRKKWPDIDILDAWRQEEKVERTFEEVRARIINEPLLVEGRLRPRKVAWHREIEEAPFRFTYFNEEFESTVHSQTISELVQQGQTFEDLFIPKQPIISDSSSEDEFSGQSTLQNADFDRKVSMNSVGQSSMFKTDILRSPGSKTQNYTSDQSTGQITPGGIQSSPTERPKRLGPRPVFWLDVLQPTEAEMRVLSKAFGIHPLTTEDIMTEEAREKVELFRNYYFVNYRSFEQDVNREDYLEPVNMYVVVFREGVVSVSHTFQWV
jgi:magnesium transporter